MPLSAARGSWRISARVSLVNQETPVERVLLAEAGVYAPAVPAQGTVAATALLLALAQHRGPVIFTGLDFCYRDILSHVRPNNFENWLAPKSNRLAGLHHQLFALAAEQAPARDGKKRGTLALDTYAGWFAEIGNADGGRRIFRLHPSDVELPGIDSISETELQRLLRGAKSSRRGGDAYRKQPPLPLKPYPSRERRSRIVSTLLAGWVERTEQLIAAVRDTAALEPLMSDPDTLSLLYLCNAAELTESRRILRLQGREAAVRKISALLENHRLFLRGLHREISGSK
jgi:hypothetical protein